jgi:subtilase family protein
MKPGVLALGAMMMALCACASLQPAATPLASTGADATGQGVATMDATRDIVLAVDNPLEPPAMHAGSSVLGYSPSKQYDAGQRAVLTIEALKQGYRMRQVAGWPIKALKLYCVVLEPPPGMSREELLSALAKDGRVQLAQPLQDYRTYANVPPEGHRYNDPYENLQRGFTETDAALAHTVSQGDRVDVAVVDTGVDATHPDLAGSIHDTHNVVDDDKKTFDRDSHGTEVAGVIAAVGDNHQGIVGMAPKASLSIYKACWYPPHGTTGARCNSFTLARALAAIGETDVRIINLSLGGPSDPLLNRLLDVLLAQGRIVVAAMPPEGGNGGFPDSTAGVIVVRTSTPSAAVPGVLSAPGTDILTTQPSGGYDFTSGSSMAAAHVSGIIALMLSIAPKLDARTVQQVLEQSSKVSGGILQVNAAGAVAALERRGKTAP